MFQVTRDTYVGRFATRERLAEFKELHITDILNVSDTDSLLTVNDGPFRTVSWINIEDRSLIPTGSAVKAIDTIHQSLIEPDGRVYVHCMAGWNRSPTVLWLYLLACGWTSQDAAKLISSTAFDAVPGHALLVDSNLISVVQAHGKANYLPHARPSSIEV